MTRLIALLALLATPVAAQDIAELAEDYVNLPANQQMISEMFAPESMASQFETGLPPGVTLSDTQRSEIGALLSGVLTDLRPDIEAAMISASATHFTEDELTALIDFYSSEAGAGVLLKMQPFFQDYMGEIQPAMMSRIEGVLPEIGRIMEGN